jgi:hypothetical protein
MRHVPSHWVAAIPQKYFIPSVRKENIPMSEAMKERERILADVLKGREYEISAHQCFQDGSIISCNVRVK